MMNMNLSAREIEEIKNVILGQNVLNICQSVFFFLIDPLVNSREVDMHNTTGMQESGIEKCVNNLNRYFTLHEINFAFDFQYRNSVLVVSIHKTS